MDFRLQSPLGARVLVAGRQRDYFSGTSYLGLHNHPQVVQATLDAVQRYGLSTGTSRGGYGEHDLYDAVEQALCGLMGTERALYFASGYLGAGIMAQGLSGQYERVFVDAWAHFSVWDAARASGQPVISFEHNDMDSLSTVLTHNLLPGEHPLILSDGVFPISGEIFPLPQALALAEQHGGWVALDDAHAVGAIGSHGRGTADYFGVQSQHFVSSATLSKALGGYGGIIAGSGELIETLERHSRQTVAASPPPLAAAAASAMAVQLAISPERRERLWRNVAQARAGLRELGWPLAETPVPIICLGVRPGIDLAWIKDQLFERDICISHVKSYSSTPPGGALRVAMCAEHTPEQIERLIKAVGELAG